MCAKSLALVSLSNYYCVNGRESVGSQFVGELRTEHRRGLWRSQRSRDTFIETSTTTPFSADALRRPSALSLLIRGVKTFEFDASVRGGEAPVDLGAVGVSFGFPRGGFARQNLLAVDAAIEALT